MLCISRCLDAHVFLRRLTGPSGEQVILYSFQRKERPIMADFVGTTVQVTLKEPPNTNVHGKVVEVIAGQTLTLRDGK